VICAPLGTDTRVVGDIYRTSSFSTYQGLCTERKFSTIILTRRVCNFLWSEQAPGLRAVKVGNKQAARADTRRMRKYTSVNGTSGLSQCAIKLYNGQLHVMHPMNMLHFVSVRNMILCAHISQSRSQLPRGLRHELSSLARTLGSWARIPLKAWMSVCVYSIFVLFFM
jgi:hypothetical protein